MCTERKGKRGPAGLLVPPSRAPCPPPPHRGVGGPLTGIVWLPCRALIAACASAWEEYFTKAHPGGTGEAEPRREGPQEGQRSAIGLRGGAREGRRGEGASQMKAERVTHRD